MDHAKELARFSVIAEQKGMVTSLEGNLSVIDRETGNIYITPSHRMKLLLTPEGKRAAGQVKGRAAVAVELAGGGFSDADRETFYQVLETITEKLQNLTKEGLPE